MPESELCFFKVSDTLWKGVKMGPEEAKGRTEKEINPQLFPEPIKGTRDETLNT